MLTKWLWEHLQLGIAGFLGCKKQANSGSLRFKGKPLGLQEGQHQGAPTAGTAQESLQHVVDPQGERPFHSECREEAWQPAVSAADHMSLFQPWGDGEGIVRLDALWLVGAVCVVLANEFRAETTRSDLEHSC